MHYYSSAIVVFLHTKSLECISIPCILDFLRTSSCSILCEGNALLTLIILCSHSIYYSKDWYKGQIEYDENGDEVTTTPKPRPAGGASGTRRKVKRPIAQPARDADE